MTDAIRPFVLVLAASIAAFVVFAASLGWYGSWLDEREARLWNVSDGYCNVAIVPIEGDIVAFEGDAISDGEDQAAPMATAGDWVERYIRGAEYDPSIVGIVAQIDSYGGYAAAGHQIMRALERTPLPTVAYIREAGISAGYMAALGADTIVASPFASVGSIGVTYSYLQYSEKNRMEGLEFVQLSSGTFKDTGNPNKPLTAEERALFERDIRAFNDIFIDLVAAKRGLAREKVVGLADGSSMPAVLAVKEGLIDAVGDEDAVRDWFARELDMDRDSIILCK